MLSPVLSGEKTFEDIIIHSEDWYEANDVDLRRGDPVIAIDCERKLVTSASGSSLDYDTLIIAATGSSPFVIPVPGATLPGVVTFRDLDDVDVPCWPQRKKAGARWSSAAGCWGWKQQRASASKAWR